MLCVLGADSTMTWASSCYGPSFMLCLLSDKEDYTMNVIVVGWTLDACSVQENRTHIITYLGIRHGWVMDTVFSEQ